MNWIHRYRSATIIGLSATAAALFGGAMLAPAIAQDAYQSLSNIVTCGSAAACVAGTNSKTGPGVQGISAKGTGVVGQTKFNSTSGTNARAGVLGQDLAASSIFNSGVNGTSVKGNGVAGASISGIGLLGRSASGVGVLGQSTSDRGVSATSSTNDGILSVTGFGGGVSNGHSGVAGFDNSTSGISNFGVYGGSTNGTGTSGNSTSGTGIAGHSTSGIAVFGGSSSNPGVVALSASDDGTLSVTSGTGSTSNNRAGVAGYDNSTTGSTNFGVFGGSTNGIGVAGQSANYFAIEGIATAGNTAPAIIGRAGTNNAGGLSFQATDVNGSTTMLFDGLGNLVITGQIFTAGSCGTGCSRIQGGAERRLVSYAPREAIPTMEDVGEARLVNGSAYVRIDPAFANGIDQRKRYLVFVTAEADTRGLFVTDQTIQGFTVRENQGGHSTAGFNYRIVASPYGVISPRLPMRDMGRSRVLDIPTRANIMTK